MSKNHYPSHWMIASRGHSQWRSSDNSSQSKDSPHPVNNDDIPYDLSYRRVDDKERQDESKSGGWRWHSPVSQRNSRRSPPSTKTDRRTDRGGQLHWHNGWRAEAGRTHQHNRDLPELELITKDSAEGQNGSRVEGWADNDLKAATPSDPWTRWSNDRDPGFYHSGRRREADSPPVTQDGCLDFSTSWNRHKDQFAVNSTTDDRMEAQTNTSNRYRGHWRPWASSTSGTDEMSDRGFREAKSFRDKGAADEAGNTFFLQRDHLRLGAVLQSNRSCVGGMSSSAQPTGRREEVILAKRNPSDEGIRVVSISGVCGQDKGRRYTLGWSSSSLSSSSVRDGDQQRWVAADNDGKSSGSSGLDIDSLVDEVFMEAFNNQNK